MIKSFAGFAFVVVYRFGLCDNLQPMTGKVVVDASNSFDYSYCHLVDPCHRHPKATRHTRYQRLEPANLLMMRASTHQYSFDLHKDAMTQPSDFVCKDAGFASPNSEHCQ